MSPDERDRAELEQLRSLGHQILRAVNADDGQIGVTTRLVLRQLRSTLGVADDSTTATSRTVRQWGCCDLADDPNEPHTVEPALTGEEEAREDASSWSTGRVVYRDVVYGPWRFTS